MKKKKVLLLLFVFAMAMTMTANAVAQAVQARCTLTFSGATATCRSTITGVGTIDATMELWYGGTLIDSWSDTGSNRLTLTGSHSVVSGQTYTLTVNGTVDGIAFNEASISKTCP